MNKKTNYIQKYLSETNISLFYEIKQKGRKKIILLWK